MIFRKNDIEEMLCISYLKNQFSILMNTQAKKNAIEFEDDSFVVRAVCITNK